MSIKWILVCFSFVTIAPGVQGSTVTGITIKVNGTDSSDICIGDSVSYQATLNVTGSDQVKSISWQYRYDECDPAKDFVDWRNTGTNPTTNVQELYLGKQTLRVSVTFQPYMAPGGSYVSTKTISLEVLPPDSAELVNINPQVLDIDVTPTDNNEFDIFVLFQLKFKGRNALSMGTPLEKLVEVQSENNYAKESLDWGPAEGLTMTDYGIIKDGKKCLTASQFPGFSTGTINGYNQYLRVTFPKNCGGSTDCDLPPPFHLRFDKVDFQHWRMYLIPQPPPQP